MTSPAAGGVLAVIPARGGSKGVPGKNIAPVGGRPLVARAVIAACRAQTVGRVVVTTDDALVADAAKAAGAEVVQRPPELAGDAATSESALLHVLDDLRDREGYEPSILVFVQCTSPFIEAADLDAAVGLLLDDHADSVFTATSHHGYLWRTGAEGEAVAVDHDPRVRLRRQDEEPRYLETGAVYALRTDGFRAARHRFFGRTRFIEVPPERALEIDTPHDLRLARAVAEGHARAERAHRMPVPVRAIAFDFDGVLTDDRVSVTQDGLESVTCHRGDGAAIQRLRDRGIEMVVLSVEQNPVVTARCQKLRIDCRQGIDDKMGALLDWSVKKDIPLEEVAYVGNDVPDIPCLLAAGIGIAPADAHPDAQAAARVILDTKGGRGIVRELEALLPPFSP